MCEKSIVGEDGKFGALINGGGRVIVRSCAKTSSLKTIIKQNVFAWAIFILFACSVQGHLEWIQSGNNAINNEHWTMKLGIIKENTPETVSPHNV